MLGAIKAKIVALAVKASPILVKATTIDMTPVVDIIVAILPVMVLMALLKKLTK